ncbi:MAG: hypothetical protein WCO22_13610, partial [Betaproteobacteria bacterium]
SRRLATISEALYYCTEITTFANFFKKISASFAGPGVPSADLCLPLVAGGVILLQSDFSTKIFLSSALLQKAC